MSSREAPKEEPTVLHIWFCSLSTNSRYIQTCSNEYLYKMATDVRWPMLSQSKQIPIQSIFYKVTNCLTQPATTFFVYHYHYTILPSGEMGSKHKATNT